MVRGFYAREVGGFVTGDQVILSRFPRTLSGSLRSPPSPREEGFIRRYSFSSYVCIRSDVMGKAVFSYRSLPRMGKGDRASGG